MSSSNPFRKKATPTEGARFPLVEAIDTSVAQASRPQPTVSFRHDDDEEQQPEPPEKKPKVVKKVRVLSPPPLSPDSPEWPGNSVPPPVAEDPFGNGVADEFGTDTGVTPPQPPMQRREYTPASGAPPPLNPFSKTLQDLESSKKELDKEERREEGAVLKAANSRASLNVDSFRRLLMTGNAGDGSGAAGQEHHHLEDEGEQSDSSTAVQIGQRKKAPPPPPSSRHGKSIRTDTEVVDHFKQRDASNQSLPSEPSQTSAEGDTEPHHADDSMARPQDLDMEPTSSAKKPAPAPPPRRGHARSESKVQTPAPAPTQKPTQDEESAPGPSSEAVLGRANSIRHGAPAPAPPPPRRPHAGQRQSMIQTSPTSGTSQGSEKSGLSTPSHEASASAEPSAIQDPPHTGNTKLSAPPPPPARNPSTRRPPSVTNMETPGRQVSGDSSRPRDGLPPPPPPSRKRGSSKGSMDGPARMASTEAVPRSASGQQQQQSAPPNPGQGNAILADLDALQREVDALRGKVG